MGIFSPYLFPQNVPIDHLTHLAFPTIYNAEHEQTDNFRKMETVGGEIARGVGEWRWGRRQGRPTLRVLVSTQSLTRITDSLRKAWPSSLGQVV